VNEKLQKMQPMTFVKWDLRFSQ